MKGPAEPLSFHEPLRPSEETERGQRGEERRRIGRGKVDDESKSNNKEVIFVDDSMAAQCVGAPLSMMGDQDIQLTSDGFICTSHKRASQHCCCH